MNLIRHGKTKDVYEGENGDIVLVFKDDATGGADGVFDPGQNHIIGKIEGAGNASLRITDYLYKKIEEAGIKTHIVNIDIPNNTMTVKAAELFGEGLECICRFKAAGSFIRRYGAYIENGTELDALFEMTIKDDDREDPILIEDAGVALGILQPGEYDIIKDLTRRISTIVRDTLAEKGIDVYDLKMEFGKVNGEIILVDEISGGSMRGFKDGVALSPIELTNIATA